MAFNVFLKEKRDDKENTTLMNAYSSEFKTNEKEKQNTVQQVRNEDGVKIIIMILILIILKHRHENYEWGRCETNSRLISRPEYKEGYWYPRICPISLRNVSYTVWKTKKKENKKQKQKRIKKKKKKNARDKGKYRSTPY